MNTKASLYLIPNTLGETEISAVLPQYIVSVISVIKFYIVENTRTARRLLKKFDSSIDIDSLTFYELNKHTDIKQISSFLNPLKAGENVGIITEAGVPGVADPGAEIVAIAHKLGIKVVPLVGPSSILLAMMASGLNGQNFAFNGYLPIQKNERISKIHFYEKRSKLEKQSQLFIETPYRNDALLLDILTSCLDETQLCIAVDITLESQMIVTKKIKEWKSSIPQLHKRPCIFILQG